MIFNRFRTRWKERWNDDKISLRKHTHAVDHDNFSAKWLRERRIYSSFRILQVSKCPPLKETLESITQPSILKELKSCSYLLIIRLQGSDLKSTNTDNFKTLITKLIEELQPVLIQTYSENDACSSIYCKDWDRSDIVVEPMTDYTDDHLASFLREKVLKSSGLLDVQSISAINSYFKIRICKLLRRTENYEQLLREVKASMKSRNLENFKAVLDLPRNSNMNEFKFKYNRTLNVNNVDLLAMAIENGNIEVVEFLVQFKCDLISNVEFCWEKRQYDCLAILIDADSPFPIDFDENSLNQITERLKVTLYLRKSFHKNIESGNIIFVTSFIEKQPKLKYAYSWNNKSALTTALDSKQLEIYSLLLSKGFSLGINTPVEDSFKSLSLRQQELVRNTNMHFFEPNNEAKHLMTLASKSKIGLNDPELSSERHEEIRKMLEELNKIPETSTVLKFIAHSENLQIVFDFNGNSVIHVNPTKQSDVRGSVNKIDNIIYIGAKCDFEEKMDRLGTFAHELTHYAMLLAYDNRSFPYEVNKEHEFNWVFEKIRDEYEADKDHTVSTIKDVFENYDETSGHKELIVRVNHLLALYCDDSEIIWKMQTIYSDLFEYFNKVLMDLEFKLAKIEKEGTGNSDHNVRKRKPQLNNETMNHCSKRTETSLFSRIDEKCHVKLDFYTEPAIETLLQHRYKIVTLARCPNLLDAIGTILRPDLADVIVHSAVFVLILEIDEPYFTNTQQALQHLEVNIKKTIYFAVNIHKRHARVLQATERTVYKT